MSHFDRHKKCVQLGKLIKDKFLKVTPSYDKCAKDEINFNFILFSMYFVILLISVFVVIVA
jgi:uncharacterized protein (DUF983 family)